MSKKPNPPRVAENEARSFVKHLRISPQKLNLVADMIRGMPVEDALIALQFSSKRIAKDVHKALSSAITTAENNHELEVDRLIVAHATAGKQMVLKRILARGRGRDGGRDRRLRPEVRLGKAGQSWVLAVSEQVWMQGRGERAGAICRISRGKLDGAGDGGAPVQHADEFLQRKATVAGGR